MKFVSSDVAAFVNDRRKFNGLPMLDVDEQTLRTSPVLPEAAFGRGESRDTPNAAGWDRLFHNSLEQSLAPRRS